MYMSLLTALGANDLDGGFRPESFNEIYYNTPDYIVFGGLEMRARAIEQRNAELRK